MTKPFFATIIAPKTRKVVSVEQAFNKAVRMYWPGDDSIIIGQAHIDTTEEYEIDGETYYRSHSPNSGVRKETGTGPALYYGLCLFAYSETGGYGIASPESGGPSGRSYDAAKFWKNCLQFGMAEEAYVMVGTEEERKHSVSASDYLGDVDCDFTGDDECTSVDDVEGDIEVKYTAGTTEEEEVQYMHWDKVAESGLLLEWEGRTTGDFEFPPAIVLAGLDLSDCKDVNLVESIIAQVRREGLEIDYIDSMLSKLPAETYRLAVAQLKLPGMTPNRKFKRNASVERNIDKAWNEYYGDLTKIDF